MIDDIIGVIGMVKDKFEYFVDVFGGSGRVAISIPPEWNKSIIYNDIDLRMYRLIKFLQKEYAEFISKSPAMIPHKKLFEEIKKKIAHTDLELLYLSLHSFNGSMENFVTVSDKDRVSLNCSAYKRLTCLNLDFRELFKIFENYDNVFYYLDPPYLKEQRYKYGFTLKDFHDLKDLLFNTSNYWLMNHTVDEKIIEIFGAPNFIKTYKTYAQRGGL